MADVTKILNFGSTDYLVGNGIIQLSFRFDADQDWTIGNTISCNLVSIVDFSDPDHPAVITDYAILYNKLKGGIPAYMSLTGPTSGDERGYGAYISQIPIQLGPNNPIFLGMNNNVLYKTGTTKYRYFSLFFNLNANGTYIIQLKSLGEITAA